MKKVVSRMTQPRRGVMLHFHLTLPLLHLLSTTLPNSLTLRTRGYTRSRYRDSQQPLSMTHTFIADSLTL